MISGGQVPHIGSVALSQARSSLQEPGKVSATSSVLSVIGHKEGRMAEGVADEIAARLQTTVVVVCGIHFDDFDSVKLCRLIALIKEGTDRLINLLSA